MSLALTQAERLQVKAWLEKDPTVELAYSGSSMTLERADGTSLELRRSTSYYGENWKVRTAFTQDEGFPVCHSCPLPRDSNSKTNKSPKWVMVPKFDAPEKVKANPGAFKKALDVALVEQKKQMKEYLNKPSMWDGIAWPKADETGMVTFKVQKGGKGKLTPVAPVWNDHAKHVALNLEIQKELNGVQSEGDPS